MPLFLDLCRRSSFSPGNRVLGSLENGSPRGHLTWLQLIVLMLVVFIPRKDYELYHVNRLAHAITFGTHSQHPCRSRGSCHNVHDLRDFLRLCRILWFGDGCVSGAVVPLMFHVKGVIRHSVHTYQRELSITLALQFYVSSCAGPCIRDCAGAVVDSP